MPRRQLDTVDLSPRIGLLITGDGSIMKVFQSNWARAGYRCRACGLDRRGRACTSSRRGHGLGVHPGRTLPPDRHTRGNQRRPPQHTARRQPDGDVNAAGTNGNCVLPTGLTGLSANVTATGATAATFLTLFPADGTKPLSSNLNPSPAATATTNSVAITLSTPGAFKVFNRFGAVDVIIDVLGYYSPSTGGAPGPTGATGPAGPAGADGATRARRSNRSHRSHGRDRPDRPERWSSRPDRAPRSDRPERWSSRSHRPHWIGRGVQRWWHLAP